MGTLTVTWGGWGGRGWATAGIATALKTIDAHNNVFRTDMFNPLLNDFLPQLSAFDRDSTVRWRTKLVDVLYPAGR